MSTTEDIARLNVQIEELKAYLNRIDDRIETVYKDMGHIRENMAKRDDINHWFGIMATKTDIDRLWKIYGIIMTFFFGLLVALIIYVLTK